MRGGGGQRWRGDARGTGGRAPTWWRCWQNSQVGPTGGPVAAPYLKLEGESRGVRSPPTVTGPPCHCGAPPPSPAVPCAVARDLAQALEVVGAAAHAVVHQGLLAARTVGRGVRNSRRVQTPPPQRVSVPPPPHLAEAFTFACPVKTRTKTRM